MRTYLLRILVALFCLGWVAGCNRQAADNSSPSDNGARKAKQGYTVAERTAAAKLKEVRDPIEEEIYKFRTKTRQAYNNRRFDELEKVAAELRASQALFANGSWKIAQFYQSFGCRSDEPENMWELHAQIHRAWTAAKPESVTARLSYADFLVDYAWHARGHEYANKVTQNGWTLFGGRLATARQTFDEAQTLPEKDPFLWVVGLSIALGQDWPESGYDALLAEAHAYAPQYWSYDTTRAISLLPRWYGQPGEWEAYADETSARPGGLGPELYARIVAGQAAYYENVFHETQASWARTREGLERMRQKYPDSLVISNTAAMLATLAEDRPLAKGIFDRLGDTYLAMVWGTPERFIQFRNRAETGQGEIR